MYGSNLKMGEDFFLQFAINSVDTLAGTSQELIAPCDGHIVGMDTIVQVAINTGGTITAAIGTTAVAGLSITVADSATKGTVQSDTPTGPSGTRKFRKGDRIQIIPAAAFATAGAVSGLLRCNTSYNQG